MADTAQAPQAVQSEKDAAKLRHSVKGAPQHTRSDLADAGVPMLPGDPSEPQGPEDAFGDGPKRGDYRARQDATQHLSYQLTDDGGDAVEVDGQVVDFKPISRPVDQNARVEDIGEAKGVKGGVDTTAARR